THSLLFQSAFFEGLKVSQDMWQKVVGLLQQELPTQQFNTWIRPLTHSSDGEAFYIYAPNRFICDWVREKYAHRIAEIVSESNSFSPKLVFRISETSEPLSQTPPNVPVHSERVKTGFPSKAPDVFGRLGRSSNLNKKYTFASFVEG